MGNWEVPFVTCWEFSIPCTRGFAARAGIIPSLNLSLMGLAQSCEEEMVVWGSSNHLSSTRDVEKAILALPLHRIGPLFLYVNLLMPFVIFYYYSRYLMVIIVFD